MENIIGLVALLAALGFALWILLGASGNGLAGRIIDWFGSKFNC